MGVRGKESGNMRDSVIVILTFVSIIVLLGSFSLYSSANQGLPCQRYAYYEYYIDYGSHETDTLQNGWIWKHVETKNNNKLRVLKQLTDLKTDKKGNILSINGISPDKNAGERWVVWEVEYISYYDDQWHFNRDEEGNLKGIWKVTESPVDKAVGLSVYIGLVIVDPLTNAPLTTPYDKGIETPELQSCC